MITLPILATSLVHFRFKMLRECTYPGRSEQRPDDQDEQARHCREAADVKSRLAQLQDELCKGKQQSEWLSASVIERTRSCLGPVPQSPISLIQD